ncbi:cytochrome c3 family protein [Desulfurivibrio sp. D14AmB]|uniref:cytochrome c3 family protein n=1 Tax=Desulfurivibrio sp. D14AmB TaxID=3374370 RepID=UPI00376F1E7C
MKGLVALKILPLLGWIGLLLAGQMITPPGAGAVIRGICADCHTMHNSQEGGSMALDGGGANPMLTRGSCVGCHAQNGGEKIVTIGGNQFPQVMHTDPSGDLAAGNFAYISGGKGSGADDRKGHNVRDLLPRDGRHDYPPGHTSDEHRAVLSSDRLTCAGSGGCHGLRLSDAFDGVGSGTGLIALKGAHHGNVDGLLNVASGVSDSYRFLDGVKGLENPDPDNRWQNAGSGSHNEYYGTVSPGAYLGFEWSFNGCGRCHVWNDYIEPPNRSISGFCATCHPDFHSLSSGIFTGVGPTTSSPFLRHPTDIVLPNSGEYQHYTTYNVTAPVGRQVLPATPSSAVNPGSDTITCLSCHLAHASDYSGMLRFDYGAMMAHQGGAASGTGCFACHTTKD